MLGLRTQLPDLNISWALQIGCRAKVRTFVWADLGLPNYESDRPEVNY